MLLGPANTAFLEQTLMMSPPRPCARSTGSTALATRNEPRGMIWYCRSQSVKEVSARDPARVMPALFTMMSTPPNATTASRCRP